jgi:hypothetical protein
VSTRDARRVGSGMAFDLVFYCPPRYRAQISIDEILDDKTEDEDVRFGANQRLCVNLVARSIFGMLEGCFLSS